MKWADIFISVDFATLMMVLYGVAMVVLFVVFADKTSPSFKRFFHFGPGTEETPVEFAGISLDSNLKYAAFVAFLAIKALVLNYTGSILSDWYNYEIFNPDRKVLGMSKTKIWVYDFVLDVVHFVTQNFSTFVFIATQQIQFGIIGFIAGWFPNQYYLYRRLREKSSPSPKKSKR